MEGVHRNRTNTKSSKLRSANKKNIGKRDKTCLKAKNGSGITPRYSTSTSSPIDVTDVFADLRKLVNYIF
jgi:hypothetical protein